MIMKGFGVGLIWSQFVSPLAKKLLYIIHETHFLKYYSFSVNDVEKKVRFFAVFNLRIALCEEFRFSKALEGHKRSFMAQHDKQQKSRRLFQLVSSPLSDSVICTTQLS